MAADLVPARPGNIPSGVMVLTDSNFMGTVSRYPLVVVDVWAPWCGPCKMASPVVVKLAQDYAGKAAFGKLNTTQNRAIPAQFKVRGVPTVMLFGRGRLAERIVGAVPRAATESKIKKHLGSWEVAADRSSPQTAMRCPGSSSWALPPTPTASRGAP